MSPIGRSSSSAGNNFFADLVMSVLLHGLLNLPDGDKGVSFSLTLDVLSLLVTAAPLHCHSFLLPGSAAVKIYHTKTDGRVSWTALKVISRIVYASH